MYLLHSFDKIFKCMTFIFEDSKIRAAYLAGEVKTMEDIINLYPSMQVAADEYTQAFEDSADIFERIADAQRELAAADTTEKQIEAQRELEAAHRAVGDAYREYAINKRLEDVGATQSTLDLAVALGVLSQEEADARGLLVCAGEARAGSRSRPGR